MTEHVFPAGSPLGAATSGHQVDGNNFNSDVWVCEVVKPTFFAEPSGDAANTFELGSRDLDLMKSLGPNTNRFGLKWARIKPESGL